MQNYALRELGFPFRYVAIRVPSGELGEALAHLSGLGYLGVNCTVPLKEEAFAWAETVDPESAAYGSLNTLDLRTGAGLNTDAPGFLDTLADLRLGSGSRVLLIGAGGTARALARALVGWRPEGGTQGASAASGAPGSGLASGPGRHHTGAIQLVLTNRTHAKAVALAQQVGAEVQEGLDLTGYHLVINTTSAGLSDEPMELHWPTDHPGVAYDVFYQEHPTQFLIGAHRAGWKTRDGREMLAAQGARALGWWLGHEVSRELLRRSLP